MYESVIKVVSVSELRIGFISKEREKWNVSVASVIRNCTPEPHTHILQSRATLLDSEKMAVDSRYDRYVPPISVFPDYCPYSVLKVTSVSELRIDFIWKGRKK